MKPGIDLTRVLICIIQFEDPRFITHLPCCIFYTNKRKIPFHLVLSSSIFKVLVKRSCLTFHFIFKFFHGHPCSTCFMSLGHYLQLEALMCLSQRGQHL